MKTVIRGITGRKGIFLLLCIASLGLFTGVHKAAAAQEQVQKLPYLIKVNRSYNTITVYSEDKNGNYTIPVKAMICSVGKGSRTVTGTFQTQEKYRWKALMGDVWGQYATRIVGGILFHSVYYYENGNPATLATNEYNKLGKAASHGCIRLTVNDAKWIYDNCPEGTTVVIYDDKKSPGPLGKPETIQLPATVRWDPTDPSEKNPYSNRQPKIIGLKDKTIEVGDKIDLLDGVQAKSSVGMDITSQLVVMGNIDSSKKGSYEITYSVADALGREAKKAITITVKAATVTTAANTDTEKTELSAPELKGINDKTVNGEVVIDKAFALAGVEACDLGKKLDDKYIDVTIEEKSTDEYCITYKIVADGKTYTTGNSTVRIDREPPVISGMKDFYLEEGEYPDDHFLMKGIAVSDNYTNPEDIELSTSFVTNPDGTCAVIYKAVDEAGNIAEEKAAIYN